MNRQDLWSRFYVWYVVQPLATRTLLLLNTLSFILWLIPVRWIDPLAWAWVQLGVVQTGFSWATPIQLISYNFIQVWNHPLEIINFLFMMSWLYMFGSDYEQSHKSHRVLGVYLMGGVLGALVGWSFATFALKLPAQTWVASGASIGILSLLFAYTAHYPQQSVGFFFFQIPMWGIALLMLAIFSLGNAHWISCLVAAAFGWRFGLAEKQGQDWAAWVYPLFAPQQKPSPKNIKPNKPVKVVIYAEKKRNPLSTQTVADLSTSKTTVKQPEKTSQSEIDRILDKINASGYASLTEEEKQQLLRASEN